MTHFRPTRESFIPKGSTAVDCTGTDAAVYVYDVNGGFYGVAFHGKAAKPDFHYRFRSAEHRSRKIAEYLEIRREWANTKARHKAERSAPHTLKAGDILSSSWGWEQTNINYYQVTRVISPCSVEIREIAGKSGPETGFMTAYKTPVKDKFIGEPMVKRSNSTNSVKIESYASASPWDGKPDRYSWYA